MSDKFRTSKIMITVKVEIDNEIRDIRRIIKFFVFFKLRFRFRVFAFRSDIEKREVTEDPATKVIEIRGRKAIRRREPSQNKKKRVVIKEREPFFKRNEFKVNYKDQRSKNFDLEQSFTTSMRVKRH